MITEESMWHPPAASRRTHEPRSVRSPPSSELLPRRARVCVIACARAVETGYLQRSDGWERATPDLFGEPVTASSQTRRASSSRCRPLADGRFSAPA